MTPSIHAVRRVILEDVEELTRLVDEYWRFEGIAGFDAARIGTQLRRLVSDERMGACWIAEKGGAPVGYLLAVYVFSLEHLGLTAEIDEFFVRPEARGKGLGCGLLKAAEETFTTAGCTNVSLQLARTNDSGRRFYLRHGYTSRSGYELLEKGLAAGNCEGVR